MLLGYKFTFPPIADPKGRLKQVNRYKKQCELQSFSVGLSHCQPHVAITGGARDREKWKILTLSEVRSTLFFVLRYLETN